MRNRLINNLVVLGALLGALLGAGLLSGCASLPPGSTYPKVASTALAHPELSGFGKVFAARALAHSGNSGYRIIPVGADGFLTRMQMIGSAQQTLDLQYFIFRGDDTGRLLTAAVLSAADRGVRVRVLLDDGETVEGDEQITALEAHPRIELRFFNPFAYRGHNLVIRASEMLLRAARLDYRMHNKLLVVDNAIALIGGRNIGDQYFQIDPQSQFADDDVFAAGPMAQQLSVTFDEFWNSALSIPAVALARSSSSRAALRAHRQSARAEPPQVSVHGIDYLQRVASGEPLAGLLSERLPLTWAHAQLIYDSPDKRKVESGAMLGRLMHRAVANSALAAQSELLMVTPYLIPGKEGMQLFQQLRQRNVRVRILTGSLESSTMLVAQSGYMHYRLPLVTEGVQLYEIRSLLGNAKGSGQSLKMSRYGNYSLHAKLFVFDRQRVFIGSMNFDQRSMHLNTEIGLIIDSPELAQQIATRFDAMVQPANAYQLMLRPDGAPRLRWHTQQNGVAVVYDHEPARSAWQTAAVCVLGLLPLDAEL